MNYIKEINAFYNEIEVTPLTTSAIALWFALLHICNRTGWKEEFSVSVGTLSLKSGLSERSVSNARNELKTKDFIDFTSRGGRKSAMYRLKMLSATIADKSSGNLSDNDSDNHSGNGSGKSSDNASALFKQNKTETDQVVVDPARVINHGFEQTFGRLPNPIQRERFCYFVDEGMETDLVLQAMQIARTNGASVNYALKILERQFDAGILTSRQADMVETERQLIAQTEGVTIRYEPRSRASASNRRTTQTPNITGFAGVVGRIPPRPD